MELRSPPSSPLLYFLWIVLRQAQPDRQNAARNDEAKDCSERSLENPFPTLLRPNRIDLPIELEGDVSRNEPEEQYRIIHPVLNSMVSAPWRLLGCGVVGVGRFGRAVRAVACARGRHTGTEALKLDYGASLRNESFMQFFIELREAGYLSHWNEDRMSGHVFRAIGIGHIVCVVYDR